MVGVCQITHLEEELTSDKQGPGGKAEAQRFHSPHLPHEWHSESLLAVLVLACQNWLFFFNYLRIRTECSSNFTPPCYTLPDKVSFYDTDTDMTQNCSSQPFIQLYLQPVEQKLIFQMFV